VGQITAGSPYPLVFILSFALLLVPTLLMGMTLPLLSQAFIDRVEVSGQIVGILYGINTLGAAFGSLLAGYVIIGAVGLDGAVRVAASLNAAVGLSAILLNQLRTSTLPETESRSGSNVKAERIQWGYRTILLASFLVGFIGLGYEMLWIRILAILNKSTAYSFPTILFVFLVGLALGSYWWGRKADQTADPVGLFWKVEIGVACLAALTFLLFWKALDLPAAKSWLQASILQFQKPRPVLVLVNGQYEFFKRAFLFGMLEYLAPILWLVLPASLLMGGGLPILDRIAINSPQVAGRRVGDVHLANILGSVAGTLIVSFVLLPALGSELTLKVLVLFSLVFLGLYINSQIRSQERPRLSPSYLIPLAITGFALIILPTKSQFYTSLFQAGVNKLAIIKETDASVMALTVSNDTQEPDQLWIGGETNGYFPANGIYEKRALTCAAASRPKRILVIGLGGGITANFLTTLPDVDEIVIVELMQGLGDWLKSNLPSPQPALDDPRVKVITDDGRRYLYAFPDGKFDLISIDPLRNYTIGHNNLYSLEALKLYRSHLSGGGVLCEWLDEFHVLPRTTATVFPEVDEFDDFLVVSDDPIHYDLEYMQAAAQAYLTETAGSVDPHTMDQLTPVNILSKFIRDRAQISVEEKGTPVLTDLDPWLEYYYLHRSIKNPSTIQNETLAAFIHRIGGCDASCQAEITRLRREHQWTIP
jgi:predicted membrane-bound spermidine synthase